MNIYLIIIFFMLVGEYMLDVIVERLNIRHASPALPAEFHGFYNKEKYEKSQRYLIDNTKFGLIKGGFFTAVTLLFILGGGFNAVDHAARSFHQGAVLTGLIFTGFLMCFSQVLSIPFSAFHTFVLEEKYGFNKTTVKTFIIDILKSLGLTILFGAPVFALILIFFQNTGPAAWLYCWAGVTFFQLILTFIAPVVILPLFNKYEPLEEGELRSSIENYADGQAFKLKGIFKMDASRRSTKSNAFFTGFGRFRRIALFDNLIEKHTVDELVSILAHEIGHYKKGHIRKGIVMSILTSGVMFYLLSFFINNQGLFSAFKMENTSIYASLVFFGFLFTPIQFLLSIMGHILSRKHEYEADAFAISTYNKPEDFINALKKLSVDNLSNLTPHPWKVFLEYTHPPVLKRIEAIRKTVSRDQ